MRTVSLPTFAGSRSRTTFPRTVRRTSVSSTVLRLLTRVMAEDILHVRLQTIGVNEHQFDINLGGTQYNWLLYDVGGAVRPSLSICRVSCIPNPRTTFFCQIARPSKYSSFSFPALRQACPLSRCLNVRGRSYANATPPCSDTHGCPTLTTVSQSNALLICMRAPLPCVPCHGWTLLRPAIQTSASSGPLPNCRAFAELPVPGTQLPRTSKTRTTLSG